MNLLKNITSVLLTIVLLISFSCTLVEDEIINPPIDNLNVRFIDGSAFTDMMPTIPPGTNSPFMLLDLEIHNTNDQESFNVIQIQTASIFLDSSGEFLGDIYLISEWNGHLDAGELDTMTFTNNGWKTLSDSSGLPCECMLDLEVVIQSVGESKLLMIDSLWHGCAW